MFIIYPHILSVALTLLLIPKKMSSEVRRLAPVDGVRSITHVSLVCLHTAMLLTGKLPAEGPLWNAFKSRIPFSFFQAGGIQVNLCGLFCLYVICCSV